MEECLSSFELLHILSDRTFGEIPSLLEKDCLIYATVQELLRHFEDVYKSHQEIPNDILSALDSVFGDTLEKALELVETKSVRFYQISDAEGIFQVQGSLRNSYIIFPFVNYCPCLAYKYQVAGGCNITCKHVLASIIAKIIGKIELIEVTPFQLHSLILSAAHVNNAMNKRENWPNQNQYVEQYFYPQPEIQPAFAPANNWVHVPPQTMPWGLPSNSHPPVVRFTASDFASQHLPVKRKQNNYFETRPAKQLVTEEKMAAHMSNLHISDIEIPRLRAEDEAMETDRLPKLFVCDEVKNLKDEPIIPESILNKIERPKMAVVLWQPPPGDSLANKLLELKNTKEKEEKDENTMQVDNNNIDNTFRPIDPVPRHPAPQNQFLQPTPQFHGYFQFS